MALPNLIIPGAQKAGSSSLAFYLSLHPECLMSTPKEPSFFSRQPHVNKMELYENHFKEYSGEKVVFDASTGYLFEKYAAERIFQKLGNVKVIIILRKPVERTLSAYFHLKNGCMITDL